MAIRKAARVHLTPRRFVLDQDIHQVDGCRLTGRQLVLRRQQSIEALLVATGGAAGLAAAIEALYQHTKSIPE